eukprot:scaffold57609_cov31-Tisochrysis_lutea.AAC.2
MGWTIPIPRSANYTYPDAKAEQGGESASCRPPRHVRRSRVCPGSAVHLRLAPVLGGAHILWPHLKLPWWYEHSKLRKNERVPGLRLVDKKCQRPVEEAAAAHSGHIRCSGGKSRTASRPDSTLRRRALSDQASSERIG